MATKALNFKMEETDIQEMKDVAGIYHMSITDLLKNAIKEYMIQLKEDPFYRLSVNVREASAEESEEILSEIGKLSDEDLAIASTKRFSV